MSSTKISSTIRTFSLNTLRYCTNEESSSVYPFVSFLVSVCQYLIYKYDHNCFINKKIVFTGQSVTAVWMPDLSCLPWNPITVLPLSTFLMSPTLWRRRSVGFHSGSIHDTFLQYTFMRLSLHDSRRLQDALHKPLLLLFTFFWSPSVLWNSSGTGHSRPKVKRCFF